MTINHRIATLIEPIPSEPPKHQGIGKLRSYGPLVSPAGCWKWETNWQALNSGSHFANKSQTEKENQ